MDSMQFSRTAVWTISCLTLLALSTGCTSTADRKESQIVNQQQATYNRNQPIPKYDWSLARHLWIQFYDAQNKAVTTFSFIQPITGGAPMFDCPAMGYALPRDTQLTNPLQVAKTLSGSSTGTSINQAEPSGLFTSPNTDATIVFCLNTNGTVSPVYTEQKVTAFPFPVKWIVEKDYPNGHWLRVGETSNIQIDPKKPVLRPGPFATP
jgi:hypothetical protein